MKRKELGAIKARTEILLKKNTPKAAHHRRLQGPGEWYGASPLKAGRKKAHHALLQPETLDLYEDDYREKLLKTVKRRV